MNDILTCTLASADERERMLAALHRAGIPDEHITLTPPEAPPGAHRQSAASADFTDWPIADGILCGCIGGAFGAYVGLLSLLIPGLEAVTTLSPSWIIIGSAAFGTAFGSITALIIKAFWPDHEAQPEVWRSRLANARPGRPSARSA